MHDSVGDRHLNTVHAQRNYTGEFTIVGLRSTKNRVNSLSNTQILASYTMFTLSTWDACFYQQGGCGSPSHKASLVSGFVALRVTTLNLPENTNEWTNRRIQYLDRIKRSQPLHAL